jgi:hypothetical protein
MSSLPVMGPEGGRDAFTSTRPPRFGDPTKEDYPSYRRDVELWLRLTDVTPAKQGVALVGCLSGEPKEFVKTMSDQLLFSTESGKNVLAHLDKAYQNSSEMILNGRVSAFLEYQRLPSMSISTYIAGFYARLDNLSQLQMPDELKGHLLLKQANLELSEKTMVVASARGSYKVMDLVDSMRQLYGEWTDDSVTRPSFNTLPLKRFCTYCKKRNHTEADCWKKRKADSGGSNDSVQTPELKQKMRSTYVTFVSEQQEQIERSALLDSGAVFTVIGTSTLDNLMTSYGMESIEKCPPLSLVHRFGTNGTPIEPEFGAIIPWSIRDKENVEHSFNLRADVLADDYPLLIGCPTLVALKATLFFEDMKLSATINGVRCDVPLSQHGNHVFMNHAPRKFLQSTNQTVAARNSVAGRYEPYDSDAGQFFRRPGHC